MTDLSCFRVTVDNEQDVDLKDYELIDGRTVYWGMCPRPQRIRWSADQAGTWEWLIISMGGKMWPSKPRTPRPHKCQWRPPRVHRGPNWRLHNIKWANWLPLYWWVSANLKRELKGKTFTMPPWWFPFGAAYGPSWSRFQDNLTDKPL